MVISCLAGGVFGFFSNFVEGKPADVIAQGIYGAVKIGLPYAIPVILVIEWIVFGILYTKCKRAYCSAVEEDEVVLDQIDNRLNYILLISSIAMVCSFFVIGCLVPLAESFSLANYFTVLLSFVIALISCLIVQYKVVDLGIHAIWNFAHVDLQLLDRDVVVENVHLSDSLMQLSYNIVKSRQ